MHELSIAEAILDLATRHAAGRRVLKIDVRVGHLRQVVPDSLDFAFQLVSQGTALDGAALDITHVPAAGRCRDCDAESVMEGFPLCCARCGGLDVEMLAGEELLVDALELEEESVTDSSAREESVEDSTVDELTVEETNTSNERVGHGSHV